jgi:ubiquitin-like modifier-activating enzyme ATG7
LKNYNTIEEFKNADKRALFNKLSDEVCAHFSVRRSLLMTDANGLAP